MDVLEGYSKCTERETYHLPRENCYKKIKSVSELKWLESKMRVNTELVGGKVPENKSCPPSFLAFCKVNYLPQGQIFGIYIYLVCMEFDEWINFLLVYETDLY